MGGKVEAFDFASGEHDTYTIPGHTEQRRYGGIRSHHQRHRSGGHLVAARSTLSGGSPEPMAVLYGTIPSGTAMSSAFAVQSTDRALMVGVSVRGTRLAPRDPAP
jgi:hypothetical protein